MESFTRAHLSIGFPTHHRPAATNGGSLHDLETAAPLLLDMRPKKRCSAPVSEALIEKLTCLHQAATPEATETISRAMVVQTLRSRYVDVCLTEAARGRYAATPGL